MAAKRLWPQTTLTNDTRSNRRRIERCKKRPTAKPMANALRMRYKCPANALQMPCKWAELEVTLVAGWNAPRFCRQPAGNWFICFLQGPLKPRPFSEVKAFRIGQCEVDVASGVVGCLLWVIFFWIIKLVLWRIRYCGCGTSWRGFWELVLWRKKCSLMI